MNFIKTILIVLAVHCSFPLVANAQHGIKVVPSHQKENKLRPTKDSLEISAYANKVVIKNGKPGKKMEIYSVVGIRVKEITIKEPNCEFEVGLAKGYYIVKIEETVRKIALR